MPRNNELKKILLIGSGPIVIGQGCEFDYSGVQACKALREERYEVVLVNSNPATIMTDPEFADRTYIEPITAEVIEAIMEREKPDAILPTLGGQTALNAAMELNRNGARARTRCLAGPRGVDRRIARGLEGVRDGGDARPNGQLCGCLFHRKFRSDGCAHRRLNNCRAGANTHRQRIPDDARRRVRRHSRDRRRDRRVEYSVCGSSGDWPHGSDRNESARVAFERARI